MDENNQSFIIPDSGSAAGSAESAGLSMVLAQETFQIEISVTFLTPGNEPRLSPQNAAWRSDNLITSTRHRIME